MMSQRPAASRPRSLRRNARSLSYSARIPDPLHISQSQGCYETCPLPSAGTFFILRAEICELSTTLVCTCFILFDVSARIADFRLTIFMILDIENSWIFYENKRLEKKKATMAILYILLFLSFVCLAVYLCRSKRKLPPGPAGVPILGNLLSIDAKAPHDSLAKLAWKYGPVCGLRMGSVYTVLLSDPKIVRQLFAKDVCVNRAPLYLTHGIMKGYGLVAAEGELWREQRKFAVTCLKNIGMQRFASPKRDKLEQRIGMAVGETIEKIETRSKGETGLDPHEILHHCIGNLMNYLVFGKTYEEDDELWKWLQFLQEEGVKDIGVSGPLNFLKFLRFVPYYGNTMNRILDGIVKTHKVYQQILEEHRKDPKETHSFMAAFDEEMQRRERSGEPVGSFTQTQCFYLLADLYGAGVDTTLMTIWWFLLFMAAFPDEQAKIQEEIDKVVGELVPTLEDRPSLVYLEAAIMESQRLRTVVPLGIPHGNAEDIQIEGYDVPKNSMIVPVLWAMHLDPIYWPEPQAFKPERFITENGNLAKPDAFLPFICGKRMCLGDEFARMIIYLFSARILQKFTLSAVPNKCIDLEGQCGITLVPKSQRLIFKKRH